MWIGNSLRIGSSLRTGTTKCANLFISLSDVKMGYSPFHACLALIVGHAMSLNTKFTAIPLKVMHPFPPRNSTPLIPRMLRDEVEHDRLMGETVHGAKHAIHDLRTTTLDYDI